MARCGCSTACNCVLVDNTIQTALNNPNFTHNLAGADGVFEQITEVPALVVPASGTYVVTITARGQVGLPADAVTHTASVYAALAKNGVVVAGTELMVANLVKGGTTATPTLNADGSSSLTASLVLAAADTLTLWAARTSVTAAVTSILSSTTGRSRIFARRIAVA